jgi:hypothetical protein
MTCRDTRAPPTHELLAVLMQAEVPGGDAWCALPSKVLHGFLAQHGLAASGRTLKHLRRTATARLGEPVESARHAEDSSHAVGRTAPPSDRPRAVLWGVCTPEEFEATEDYDLPQSFVPDTDSHEDYSDC